MPIKCLFFMLMVLLLAQQKTSYSRDQKPRHTDNKNNRIKPYHENASYWQYKGLPVFLLGGNKLVNPYQLEQHELLNYLDELQSSGGNYFRNVMSDREPGNIKAFKKMNDDRYDLTQWNEDYWDGLRRMLKWSYERDIIVNLTFWDRFDHYDQIGHRDTSRAVLWVNSPWNPVNNVNYTIRESGLDSTYVGHPISGINPFHQSVPSMKDLSVVLHFQQKFIEKVLDLSLEYDHVIYNMGNEHQLDLMQWDVYWVHFVRDYASAKGHEIETTAMFDHVIDSDGEWARVNGFSPVIESNDLFTFVEGSKVGSQWTDPGEAQYEAAIELINHAYEYEKRPVNAVKVRTQNIVYNPQERLWRLLMAGFAALSHHRDYLEGLTPDGWPIGGLALTEMAKTNIQAMRIFTDLIIPWESVPRQDLLSGREDDEAYLMAKEGSMYGLYFPKGSGSIGLDLQNFQRSFIMRWVDIGKGQVILETEVKGGGVITIETPYDVEFGWACAITVLNGKTVTDFDKMQRTKHEIKQQDSKALAFYNSLIANADNALTEGPFSVTNKTGVPPSGSKHDYMTLAPYFWPNPDTPDGLPYIRKDGEVNPETRDDYTDFIELRRFFSAVDMLGEAFYYSGDEKFADKAISLIRAWFIDPATIMNPHLNYGQGIPGHVEGRPFGIIEFGGIRNVLSTMEILKHKNSMDAETEEGVGIWLSEYSNWLQTSELGVLESTRSNNHGTTYDGQLYNILLYLGEIDQVRRLMETVTINRINDHIEPDGSQPHELDRTRSHSYSITNLSAHTRLAVLGKKVGVDLWNYESPDGGSIKKAYEFLIQYLVTDKEWEYQQISSLSASKIRFANLLLEAGKEFDEVEFVEIAQEYLRAND